MKKLLALSALLCVGHSYGIAGSLILDGETGQCSVVTQSKALANLGLGPLDKLDTKLHKKGGSVYNAVRQAGKEVVGARAAALAMSGALQTGIGISDRYDKVTGVLEVAPVVAPILVAKKCGNTRQWVDAMGTNAVYEVGANLGSSYISDSGYLGFASRVLGGLLLSSTYVGARQAAEGLAGNDNHKRWAVSTGFTGSVYAARLLLGGRNASGPAVVDLEAEVADPAGE